MKTSLSSASWRSGLLLEAQFLQNGLIALFVAPLEVLQVGAAVGNHLQQAAARVLVFGVFLEVSGQLLDALAEDGDLHVSRARVGGVQGDFFDNFLLFLGGKHGPYGSTGRQFAQGVSYLSILIP